MNEKEIVKSRLVEGNHNIPIILIAIGAILSITGLVMWGGVDYEAEYLGFVAVGVPIAIIGIFILLYVGNCQMVVTDKRVYGKAAFGKQVDLPIDSVSAVGLSYFNTVSVSTSSGRISFVMLENKEEISRALRDLLISRQSDKNSTYSTSMAGGSADELKKYKELLDSGVISQEEFDAKKKQLLGL